MDINALTPELKEFIVGTLKAEQDSLSGKLTDFEKKFQGQIDDDIRKEVKGLEKRLEDLNLLLNKPSDEKIVTQVKSMGQQFVDSPDVKAQLESRAWRPNMSIGEKFDTNLFSQDLREIEIKTLIDTTAVGNSTPGVLNPRRLGSISRAGVRRLRVRDLLNVIPTVDNAVDFIKENAWTNAAYPQVEGEAKGESALTFTVASAPVKTIAHWIPATRQILADFARLRNAIDFRLMNGLADREDYELLRGDGTGEHITGLVPSATAFSGGYGSGNTDTRIDTISRALEQLDALERMATGVVLNPADWRAMQRIKDQASNVGNYVMGGPASSAAKVIWDQPVVLTNAMPAGRFLVGDFENGAELYQREETRIDVSNSHSDFFTKNKVAILAEERIALAIMRADYFVTGLFYL